jgi:hypothetical protein
VWGRAADALRGVLSTATLAELAGIQTAMDDDGHERPPGAKAD